MKKLSIIISLTFLLCLVSNIVFASEMITLKDVPKKVIYEDILAACMKSGLTIKTTSEYSLVFEDNRRRPLEFTLNWGAGAKVLHSFNFVQNNDDTIVSYEIQIVSHPGSAKEQTNAAIKENLPIYFPGNRDDLKHYISETNDLLMALKTKYNGSYLYGLSLADEKKKNYIEITNIRQEFPAAKDGLVVGDKIVKFDGNAVKSLSKYDIDNLLYKGDDGASITLTILRDNKEFEVTLTKQFFPPIYKKSA